MTETLAANQLAPGLVVVLAAGAGTRMRSATAKVLHPVLGKPMLGHVLDAVAETDPGIVAVVVGHQRERVEQYVAAQYPQAVIAVQDEQHGTGHAVACALAALAADGIQIPAGPLVVLAGDTPLLTGDTVQALVASHTEAGAAVTVLSAIVSDPTGYGRIVRDVDGTVAAIVEQRDATPAELAIDEINSGMFTFEPAILTDALTRLTTDNSQGEQYLTDVLGIAHSDGRTIGFSLAPGVDNPEIHGINDRAQLAEASAMLRDRVNSAHLRAGVTIVDPATTWIEVGAALEPDCVIERNTSIDAGSSVAAGAVVGPDTTLIATTVASGGQVLKSHCDGADIGQNANVGPYSYLRPGAILGEATKVGAYVEVKKSTIGRGSKVPHLSYVGDAEIGEGSNIGAATIFANYDGVAKHRTSVGNHVRVGSDTMLVAPVTVGDGAYTGAGSVVTEDVPAGAIAVGRSRQVNIEGWVGRRRPGTESAKAAAAAQDSGQND